MNLADRNHLIYITHLPAAAVVIAILNSTTKKGNCILHHFLSFWHPFTIAYSDYLKSQFIEER